MLFFNVDGGIMFKVFVGRDEKRELKADQLAKFRALADRLCGSDRHEPAGSSPIGGNSTSTERWKGVPRGTMDEVSSSVAWTYRSLAGKAAQKFFRLVLESMMETPWPFRREARARE